MYSYVVVELSYYAKVSTLVNILTSVPFSILFFYVCCILSIRLLIPFPHRMNSHVQ